MSGTFYIISAPSGAGKTSLIDAVLSQLPNLSLSTSYTTRPPRAGEVDGQAYHFVSEDKFMALEASGFFLESARVFSSLYGTAKTTVDACLSQGTDVLLEIDWQGALQIKRLYPGACWIFILPPSLQALEDRLCRRQKDSDAVIAARMAEAKTEMVHCHESDYLIINDDFEQACQDFITIVASHRLKTSSQQKKYGELLENLI